MKSRRLFERLSRLLKIIIFLVVLIVIAYILFGIPIYFRFKVLWVLFHDQFFIKLKLFSIGFFWRFGVALILFLILLSLTPFRKALRSRILGGFQNRYLWYFIAFIFIYSAIPALPLYLKYALYLNEFPQIERPMIMDFIYNTDSFYQSYMFISAITILKNLMILVAVIAAIPFLFVTFSEEIRRQWERRRLDLWERETEVKPEKSIEVRRRFEVSTALLIFLASLIYAGVTFLDEFLGFYIQNPEYVRFGVFDFLKLSWVLNSLILFLIALKTLISLRKRDEFRIMLALNLVAFFAALPLRAIIFAASLFYMPLLEKFFGGERVERIGGRKTLYALLLILVIVSPIIALSFKSFLLNQSVSRDALLNTEYKLREINANRWVSSVEDIEEISPQVLSLEEFSAIDVDEFFRENEFLMDRIKVWDYKTGQKLMIRKLGERYFDTSDTDIFIDADSKRLYWVTYKTLKPTSPVTNNFYTQHIFYVGTDELILTDANTKEISKAREKIYFGEGKVDYRYVGVREEERVLHNSYDYKMYLTSGKTTNLEDGPEFDTKKIAISGLTLLRLEQYGAWKEYKSMLYIPYRSVNERTGIYVPLELERDLDSYIARIGGKFYILTDYNLSLDAHKYIPYVNLKYKRNVIKTLTNMENGEVDVFYVGPEDIFKRIFMKTYPWIREGEEMSDELKKQLRAPDNFLFYVANAYTTYHIKDPKAYIEETNFYSIDIKKGDYLDAIYYIISRNPASEEHEYSAYLQLILRESESKEITALLYGFADRITSKIKFYVVKLEGEKISGKEITQGFLDNEYQSEFKLFENVRRDGNIIIYPFTYEKKIVPLYLLSVYKEREASVDLWNLVAIEPRTQTFAKGQTPGEAIGNLLLKLKKTGEEEKVPELESDVEREKGELLAELLRLYLERAKYPEDSKEYEILTQKILEILERLQELEEIP